jgi:uncharacterized protein
MFPLRKIYAPLTAAFVSAFLLTVQTQAQTVKLGLEQLDKKEFKKALESFDKSFKEGDADGGFYLGRMVELGVGIQANPQAAVAVYKMAAQKGSSKAMNRVGLLHFRGEAGVLQDFAEAKKFICGAADKDDKDGQFNCGELYLEGKGVVKDEKKAVDYYEKAAKNEHIGALNVLGLMYRDGKNVTKDFAKAKSNFEKSAAKGNPVGLYELGSLFEQGQVAAKDLAKAHLYYNLANARNHPKAAESLARVSSSMTPVELEKAQLDARNWKAAP